MPQKGIFIEGTSNCLFQEFKLRNELNIFMLKEVLLKLYKLKSETLNIVIAFSKTGMVLLGKNVPNELIEFKIIVGVENLNMPST